LGVEAANYRFKAKQPIDSSAITAFLTEVGAVPAEGGGAFVLSSPAYWIDLQSIHAEPGNATEVSLRIALCNPDDVLKALRTLFRQLLERFEGMIIDEQRDAYYWEMGEESWFAMCAGFHHKQDEFRRYFGDFVAPISATDVFGTHAPHFTPKDT
jgi:hypothetical protein